MSILMLKIMLALGMVGHAINMYCDRILSIFPNGTINFGNIKEIGKGDMAAKLMEGASPKTPMRSAVLGAFALVLEFCGYGSLAIYTYGYSKVYGILMFALVAFFCIVGAGFHVKTALAEYAFLKLGKDEKAKGLMLDLMLEGGSLKLCMVGLIAYLVVFIIVVATGTIGFPLWALIFTVFPIILVLAPFRIIGTIHIAAIISMFAWLLLI